MLDLYNENEKRTITEILFDAENTSPIGFIDEKSNKITMEQAFAVKYEGQVYCILVPLNEIIGVKAGTGFVFKVINNALKIENGEEMCARVFKDYYAAIRESRRKKGA